MREQLDRLLGSKAWIRLMNMGSVQMAVGYAKSQLAKPDNKGLEQIKMFFDQEENKPLLELLQDIGSQECFIYGDKQFAPSMKLVRDTIITTQLATLILNLQMRY